jgi:hypothetical protein
LDDIESAKVMRNARHVIAVTLMATAICADRGLPSAPAEPQTTSHFAGRLMERFCINFRRTVPSATLCQPRRFDLRPAEMALGRFDDLTLGFIATSLSPFQFRLPPPIA